ncbi:MAG: hypothetical protein ACYDEB_06555 [Dehalococcoidia bacterium]
MRTLVFVLGLLLLILAAGGSFVVRAQGIGSATLEAQCRPRTLPSGIDTLVTCIFTARSTAAVTLANATLEFQPGQGALPDAYYFLSAVRKGAADAPVAENQLDYDLGDLAPGATVTLAIEVIVRSGHPYAPDAVLLAGADRHQYARLALGSDVAPAEAARLVVSLAVRRDDSGQPTHVFDLAVRNDTGAAINGAKLLLFYGESAALSPAGAWQIGPGGPAVRTLGVLQPSGTMRETLTFVSNGVPCAYAHPAILVIAAGPPEGTFAAISDGGAALGTCIGGQGGGGDAQPLTLPQGGTGGAGGADGLGMPAPVFAIALGLLLVAAGLSVRRVR